LAQKLRTIAILSENNAYGSIVEMVLAGNHAWRVRLFSSAQDLETYSQIVDVDVLVADLDFEDNNAQFMLRVITRLRQNTESVQAVIVTTRSLMNWSYPKNIGAGIDEVLVKPMSPVYLSERVEAHIALATKKLAEQRAPETSHAAPSNKYLLPDDADFPNEQSNVIAFSTWRRKRDAIPTDA
jgi:two-component system phosphate regulon response regulator PhoB